MLDLSEIIICADKRYVYMYLMLSFNAVSNVPVVIHATLSEIYMHLHVFLFQIKILKGRYDRMIDMDKRTGTKPYFESMRNKLEDCFTAILDVIGSAMYGSGSGLSEPSKMPICNGGDGDSIMVSEQDSDDINNKPKKG